MENVVSIVNTRENELEFDISVQGVETKETTVRFVIEASPIQYGFECRKGNGDNDKWNVIIPPVPQLAHAGYPFHLEVIIDGYYFEPYRGTVNVTAEPAVTSGDMQTSRPVAPVVTAPQPKEEDEEVQSQDAFPEVDEFSFDGEEEQEADFGDDEAEKLADILLQNRQRRTETPVTETVQPTKKDKAVHEAIVDFMKKPLGGLKKKEEKPNILEQDADDVMEAAMKETKKVEPTKPRKSNLSAAISKMNEEPELSEQAIKVRAILNSTD